LCAICNKKAATSNSKTITKSAILNKKIDHVEEQKEEKPMKSTSVLSKFEALEEVENAGSKNKDQWKKGRDVASNFDQPLNLAPPRK